MRLVLPDALHARPANLLVRLAAQHGVSVELRKGTYRASAHKILDVLSLGAVKGDEIEVVACGEGADVAIAAIAELIARNFDGDLVPERGSGAVEGVAIGKALVVQARARAEAASDPSPREEVGRLRLATRRALEQLDLLIQALGPDERGLFEPERAIVSEVAEGAIARVEADESKSAEDAVLELTESAPTDLIIDARARLLEGLSDDGDDDLNARTEAIGEEVILVAELLTPSLVARLPPRVRGIVAVDDDPDAGKARTSHAAILARGREIPLALVASHVAMAIVDGETVVVDTVGEGGARVWVAPSAALLDEARGRRSRQLGANAAETARAIGRVAANLGVALMVNVGSVHDRVPEGVAGIGLLRTELLFAGRATAPSESDQVASLLAVARAGRGGTLTARLWDAGGDKPLAWLPPGDGDARGAALLFQHPKVLSTQLGAVARAAERTHVRVLIPMTRTVADVEEVRTLLASKSSKLERVERIAVGAMIETPESVRMASAIAQASDFVCIGTNDLAALLLGSERSDASQALDRRVLALIDQVVRAAHAVGKRVTICGEVAADPRGAKVLVGLGVDALSVAPPRVAETASALEAVTIEECRAIARESLSEPA
jgi:phosphotransferase system HPr (HPr) family protein